MKSAAKTKTIGFGRYPDSTHYFVLHATPAGEASLWEKHDDVRGTETRHAVVPGSLWRRVKSTVMSTFNDRLKAENCNKGKWEEYTHLDRYLGNELAVLMWGLEGCSNRAAAEKALDHWIGLAPSERWWLFYRICSVSSPKENPWKKALYCILLEEDNNGENAAE